MSRPRILIASALVLLATVATGPAEGAESTQRTDDPVVVIGGPPEGWNTIRADCADPAGEVSGWQVAPQFGPGATTGTSAGSLLLRAGASDIEGFERSFPTFSDLASLGAWVREDAGSGFAFRVTVDTGAGLRSLVWRPEALAEPTFHGVSPYLNSSLWTIYDGASTGTSYGTTTLEDYQRLHPDRPFTVGVVSWGCDAESTIYLDRLGFQVNGVFYSYDFEPEPASISIAADRKVLTFGRELTVTGTARDMDGALLDGHVRLVANPVDHMAFEVGALDTTDGLAEIVDTPEFTTTYRWELAGEGVHGAALSAARTVVVRSRVSAELLDASVRKGQRVKVAGKVAPGWRGLEATLWRRTADGRVRLGTTRTDADSTFTVRSAVISTSRSATWQVYVTVPATDHNAAGRSGTLSVTVN